MALQIIHQAWRIALGLFSECTQSSGNCMNDGILFSRHVLTFLKQNIHLQPKSDSFNKTRMGFQINLKFSQHYSIEGGIYSIVDST